jgi:hypothetical protein
MILEDKIKWSTMGEATYNEAWLKQIKLQHDVSIVDLELTNLEWEELTISTQLLHIQNGGGCPFSFNPSYIPIDPIWWWSWYDYHQQMWLMWAVPQWYHCGDIVVTFCGHTYHLPCIGEHLKINNRCKVRNQQLHLDWWSN